MRIVSVVLLACALTACASPARVNQMVVRQQSATSAAPSPLARSVCVGDVSGGEKTNPLWTSEVDNAGFRGALEGSLRNRGLAAASPSACRYNLNANLLGLAQPSFGFNMKVIANVNYRLLESATGDPYHQATVVTPYTAKFGDSLLGVERLRLANEGAIKANISEYLKQLDVHTAKTPPPALNDG